jgi:GcrA cell cycle regulator
MSIWNTEGVVDFLKERYGAGDSAADIAAKINTAWACSITRSSVLGKLHRLGLVRSPATVRHTMRAGARMKAKMDRREPKKAQPTVKQSALAAVLERAPREPAPKEENPADFPDRVKLQDLTERACRWPIGDPLKEDFGFCGHAKVRGLPYCEQHARRAYQPPQPRVRKPVPERIPTIQDLEKV